MPGSAPGPTALTAAVLLITQHENLGNPDGKLDHLRSSASHLDRPMLKKLSGTTGSCFFILVAAEHP
jgi:hypothetical protein